MRKRIYHYFGQAMGIPTGDFLSEVWAFTQSWMLIALIAVIPVIIVGGALVWVVLPLFGIEWRFLMDSWFLALVLCALASSYVVPLVYRLRAAAELRRRN